MSAFYDKILDYKARGQIYVIAELGSNWKTRENLLNSVTLAKACGADAIKFQYLTESELYGPVEQIDPIFPLFQLKEKADATGIDFLCSAFSVAGLTEVNKYVPAHKIASSEMSHIRLLKAAKDTGKPIILSTGAYFLTDIQRAITFLDGSEVIPLHCNVKYPARYTKLKKFDELKALYPLIGFSDHTTSIELVPLFYKSRGAVVLEKHFNPFDFTDTPDAPHSLDREEFRAMVSYLRDTPNDFDEEGLARLQYVRRVIAIKDIAPGDMLKEGENIGIFRSRKPDPKGLNPFSISRLEGRLAASEIPAGEGIALSDLR